MADLLTRDYNSDTINLSDISVHNGIEHDASLLRTFEPKYLPIYVTYMTSQDMIPITNQINRSPH